MKKIIYALYLLPFLGIGQTITQNYIKTLTYKEATTTSDAAKARINVTYFDGLGRPVQQVAGKMSGTGKDLITPIAYDGFGRQIKEYLPYQATTADLSFDAAAQTNVLTFYNTLAFSNTPNPYSEKFLEASPLNRVVKQGAPGTPWLGNAADNNDHTVKYAYLSNADNEVKKLKATATWDAVNKVYNISIIDSGTYPAGQLYKTITKDENSLGNVDTSPNGWSPGQVLEYKDKDGRLILKKMFFASYDNFGMPGQGHSSIYYIYDQYGNLAYVLPTAIANYVSVDATTINMYGYQYKYDSRNRLVEKKLPGRDWEYIIYDNLDRPVATGPAYSPFGSVGNTEKGWLITKYDAFGRVAYTGWLQVSGSFSSSVRNAMQANTFTTVTKTTSATLIDNVQVYYTNPGYPTSGLKLLTVNYYDNYTFPLASLFPSAGIEGEVVMSNAKGLQTGSWRRILTTSSQYFATVSTTFYDSKSRPIRVRSTNSELGGYTQVDSKLNFEGAAQYAITRQKRSSSSSELELVVRNDYTYTEQGRLLTETHTIGSGTAELMASNTYNTIGQLSQKMVGRTSVSPLQQVNYKYNIRGWLESINDITSLEPIKGSLTDLFAFKINYTGESEFAGVSPNFNGNITETSWRTKSDNIMRRYSYKYDDLGRLNDAFYQIPQAVEPMRNSYDESIKYDFIGNIRSLKRNGGLDSDTGPIAIDNLTYTYTGNRLDKIVDGITNSPQGFNDKTAPTVNDFGYDSFGNLTSDLNKGIQANGIIYNHLNLPVKITIADGTISGTISYFYTADGTKVRKTVVNNNPVGTTTTDYLSGFQYTNAVLDYFTTSEGYVKNTVVNNSNTYNYVYHYKDHLGNIRLSYTIDPADSKLKIMEENHYYPFGLKHQGYSSDQQIFQPGGPSIPIPVTLVPVINPGNVTYKIKYQGQERQDEMGLNWDSFKWRNYDYAIGRFFNIDPLAEDYVYNSPYAFAENKVIANFELEGLEAVSIHTRSFAPFKTFGGGFSGDGANRGFTTSSTATARIKQTVNIDFNKNKPVVSGGMQTSDATHHPIRGEATAASKNALENVSVGKNSLGHKQVGFTSNMEGANPLVPEAPDIDINAHYSISSNQETGLLSISAYASGDKFPSAESFISDASGNSVFIGVSNFEGSPFSSLGGEGSKEMFNSNLQIKFDSKGTFQNVIYNDKQYNLNDYNKMFETQTP